MEKKKLLLVAVSVGVVLLIIISIPLLLISPGRSTSLAAAAPEEFYPSPEIYAKPEITWPETPEPQAVFAQPEETPVENPHVTAIIIPKPHTPAVPDIQVTPAPKTVAAAPASVKPAPARPAPEKPAVVEKPAPKPAPAPAPKSDNSNYWVQAGAFSTQVRAEGVKESLASKGITSIIDNRDIDGKTLYRVRVGPYISEKEASYWLALVKSIDGFGDSQIRQTPQ